MKLIKCKKCGATVMTADTLLATMQEEYNLLAKRCEVAKGPNKPLILHQMSQLKKMMTAVCHSSSEAEKRKNQTFNELSMLKKHVIGNGYMTYEEYEQTIETPAKEITKKKIAEDEKEIERLYGDFENQFCNQTKRDPTAKEALNGR